jgi:predicted RNase H-like HicB family nuclease
MPLITIVESYIFAALERALADSLEDGTVVATIPDFPGVIAYGADTHECARELYRLVEDTVRAWLANGYHVPILDGIDLNSAKGQVLASYHQHPESARPQGDFYEDEHALERACEARRKTA